MRRQPQCAKIVVSVAATLVLFGCASEPSKLEQAFAAAEKEWASCPQRPHLAKAECIGEVERRVLRPAFPDPVSLDLVSATRKSLAGKLDRGEIRQEDADLEMARLKSSLSNNWDRMALARRSVVAQERASDPVSCTKIGNTVSCY